MNNKANLIVAFILGFIICGAIWLSIGIKTTNVDWFIRISCIATAIAVIVAAIALIVNHRVNKRRVAFDSLVKLEEMFHVNLKEDRDKVVDVKIEDQPSLKTFLKELEEKDNTQEIQRAIMMVLNFFALMGMMIQDKYLSDKMALKYFGAGISHKVGDWKAYIDYLNKDENYKEMIERVNYIHNLACSS